MEDLNEANDPVTSKHSKFTESGIKIESFSMRNEIRSGIITKDGAYKLQRERDGDYDVKQDDE